MPIGRFMFDDAWIADFVRAIQWPFQQNVGLILRSGPSYECVWALLCHHREFNLCGPLPANRSKRRRPSNGPPVPSRSFKADLFVLRHRWSSSAGERRARGGGARRRRRGVPNGEMETVHCAYLSRRYFVKGQKRFCFLGVSPANIRE